VLAESAAGPALGMITLTLQSPIKAELGWVLAREHWGRGYMPEAVRGVIELALGALGRYRVAAYTDFENARSARVMEKAGMQYEGRLRRCAVHPNMDEAPRDALLYAAWR
jgi:RimJ/RimL family protein N-acetyltransferase